MKNWNKIKPKLNLVIDFIMLIVMMAVAGLGFLMKYVLLPGYKVNEVYGSNVGLYFWGLDRHQWGAIHLYLALFLVFLLVLHIIFHWDMIVCILRQMVQSETKRLVLFIIIGVLSLFLALVPFFIKPEIEQLERKHNRNRISETSQPVSGFSNLPLKAGKTVNNDTADIQLTVSGTSNLPSKAGKTVSNDAEDIQRHHNNAADINGTMTLNEISARFNISVEELAKAINVPADYANERLKRLRKRYEFEMNDLRVFVLGKSRDND